MTPVPPVFRLIYAYMLGMPFIFGGVAWVLHKDAAYPAGPWQAFPASFDGRAMAFYLVAILAGVGSSVVPKLLMRQLRQAAGAQGLAANAELMPYLMRLCLIEGIAVCGLAMTIVLGGPPGLVIPFLAAAFVLTALAAPTPDRLATLREAA